MKRIIRKYGPPIFHCINDFGQGSLAVCALKISHVKKLNYYQSATIIFCNTVVASIAQPALGYVADRWRVPWFIPAGFTVTLVSISSMALATSYEMILALSLLAGVGAALFHPEAALLVKRTQSHEIGSAMGRFAVGGSAGFALGPLLAGGVYIFGCSPLLLCSVCCYNSMPLRARLIRLMLVKVKALLHQLIRVRMIGRALVSYSLLSLHDLYCSPYYLSLFLFCTLPLLTVKPAPLAWL